ncbi:hypothetical protein H8S33_14365 [Ornithinibacillus sp. BX22]|uniref:Uncharacterized protein n=1 Tax=Ornithinibacillus hominis TaxID=2763055 RepID=A0A923L7I6_9BACI|nr:hypothetical protein [Ornithinibacillus hominis]MBC5637977.1 hypothetical protein [Ornithinibacillus hominis]
MEELLKGIEDYQKLNTKFLFSVISTGNVAYVSLSSIILSIVITARNFFVSHFNYYMCRNPVYV